MTDKSKGIMQQRLFIVKITGLKGNCSMKFINGPPDRYTQPNPRVQRSGAFKFTLCMEFGKYY